jgi:hypothetical protein
MKKKMPAKPRETIHMHFKKQRTYCGREKHPGNNINLTDNESEVNCKHCLRTLEDEV